MAAAPAVAAAPAPTFTPLSTPVPASNKGMITIVVVAILIVFGAAASFVVYMNSRPGSLLVTVTGPNFRKLDAVQVYLDNELRCEASPCQISGLKAGNHIMRAAAPGYQAAEDVPIAVEAGKESSAQLTLSVASRGTGISVTSEVAGLTLLVDGQKVGPLPQDLKDMTPGEHKIRVESDSSDNYELAPFEQTISVQANEIVKIEPKLKVLKGQVKIEEGDNASKATVLLVAGNDRKRVPTLPANLKLIDAAGGYAIVATRDGFEEYRQEIQFEPGEPVKTYTVSLQRKSASTASAPASAPAAATPRPSTQSASTTPSAPAAKGNATLNLNSIPVSNVILDGRPIGSTPKIGVSVSPGTHTVVFVHAELGRKVQTVTVEAGETKTAAVRFQQ